MLVGQFALALAAAFAGAALYVNVAERPGPAATRRREHAGAMEAELCTQLAMQASLAVIAARSASSAGLAERRLALERRRAVLISRNCACTLIGIMPTNHKLNAIAAGAASQRGRAA